MDARTLTKLKKDLTSFLDDVAGTLGNPRRRRWCEVYLRGVLLDGHRKSIEPMAAHRDGFKRLLAEIRAGQVGVVLALEASQLARSSADWHRLVEICVVTDTLLADETAVYYPRDPNDRLL